MIEAIAERMDWKHDLYKKVAPALGAQAIFASNTSGLSITALSEGFDGTLKARFCGVHFFNPPRYMHLVELIPTATTAPAILDDLETFLTSVVGKGVVRAKDTPNFIANRVGIFSILAVVAEGREIRPGLRRRRRPDRRTLGRAKSATFRTADVVGLDTMAHVIKTMQDTLADDPFYPVYQTPAILKALVEKGALGQKTGAGFYKKGRQGHQGARPREGRLRRVGRESRRIGRAHPQAAARRTPQAPARIGQPPGAIPLVDLPRRVPLHRRASRVDRRQCARRRSRDPLGASVGTRGRSRAGRRPAGSRLPNGSRPISTRARRSRTRRCLPGYSRGKVAENQGVHAAAGAYSPASQDFVPRSTLAVYDRQVFRAPVFGAARGRSAQVRPDLVRDRDRACLGRRSRRARTMS